MKRFTLTIAILGMFGVFAATASAANIVLVDYGHHHGHYGGYYGPRVVYAPGAFYTPVPRYPSVSGYFPNHPSLFPPPCYYGYYYPQSSFYYASPGFAVGIGF